MKLAPIGLILCGLATTVLFQNCSNGGSLTMYGNSISSANSLVPNEYTPHDVVVVPNNNSTQIDFTNYGVTLPTLNLDVVPTGPTVTSVVIDQQTLPQGVTVAPFSTICPNNYADQPSGTSILNLVTEGYFVYSDQGEAFVRVRGITGVDGSGSTNYTVNSVDFDVLVRNGNVSMLNFQRRICVEMGNPGH